MLIKKLRLSGFKSFVEPAELRIEPGLTGVVGPNGCGKSNLVEALRWAMGESSHKAMRAGDMNQVIFAGSGERPARNTAEVALTIDNADRTAPAIFNEYDILEVSRRIEREQGSTYRVNGREVRARDVQLLFADASTGARSPALVHQGKVGEIVNAKPEARRRVLEEAAGVAGLHARRHEAELRLRAAEHNLERLEDVIGQLAAQMDALKRQARQAVRYKAVSAQVRKAEATLFHLRHLAAKRDVAEGERARDLAVRLVAERTEAQAQAAVAQTTAAAALPALRETEAKAAAVLQRLVIARETLDREEARANDRIAELDRRLAHFADDVARERRLAADADAALERLATEETALQSTAANAGERRMAVETRLAEAETALAEAERAFSQRTEALAHLSARRNQLEQSLRESAGRLERLERQLADFDAEGARLETEKNGGPDLLALATAIDAAQFAMANAEVDAQAAEARHADARRAFEAARGPLAAVERHAAQLDTEARTLNKVLQADAPSMWPPALDLITVEKGYEAALGAAFGDDINAAVDSAAPERWSGAPIDSSDPMLPYGATALSRHVTAPPELARRLAQIGVVERADGARLASYLKPGQRLVSREGDLWRWDGYAAAAHAPTAAVRRLAQKNRLAEIRSELVSAQADVARHRDTAEQAEAEAVTAGGVEVQTRMAWRERQRVAETARAAHGAAERDLAQITARLAALADTRANLADNRDETVAHEAAASRALGELAHAGTLEQELVAARADATDRRATLAEVRAESQGLTRELEHVEWRLSAIASERTGWNDRRTGAAAQIATIEERAFEAQRERAELDGAPAQFAERRHGLIAEIDAAQATRREAGDRLAAGESALAAADRAARAALEAMGSAREDSARSEERFEAAKRRLVEIAREIVEVLEVEPERAAQLADIEDGAELPEVAAVEGDLER